MRHPLVATLVDTQLKHPISAGDLAKIYYREDQKNGRVKDTHLKWIDLSLSEKAVYARRGEDLIQTDPYSWPSFFLQYLTGILQ